MPSPRFDDLPVSRNKGVYTQTFDELPSETGDRVDVALPKGWQFTDNGALSIRSGRISHAHQIASMILEKRTPRLRWRPIGNHIVTFAQSRMVKSLYLDLNLFDLACELWTMIKRRIRDATLPSRLSAHPMRVATITLGCYLQFKVVLCVYPLCSAAQRSV